MVSPPIMINDLDIIKVVAVALIILRRKLEGKKEEVREGGGGVGWRCGVRRGWGGGGGGRRGVVRCVFAL